MDYQALFDYMNNEYGVTLLETDMQEIENIFKKYSNSLQPIMDKIKIVRYLNGRHDKRADVYKNGIQIAEIRRLYDITPDWILIYGYGGGGQLESITKGPLIEKIYIGNCEMETIDVRDGKDPFEKNK